MAPPVTHTPHFPQLAPIRIHCIPMAPLPVANSWHSSTALFGKTLLDSEAGKESRNPQMHSHMHPSTLHPFTYPCTHPDLPVLHAQLLSLLPLLTQGCQKHPKIFYALRAAPKILNSCGSPGSCCPWGCGKDLPTPCPDGFSQEKIRFSWFCFSGNTPGEVLVLPFFLHIHVFHPQRGLRGSHGSQGGAGASRSLQEGLRLQRGGREVGMEHPKPGAATLHGKAVGELLVRKKAAKLGILGLLGTFWPRRRR